MKRFFALFMCLTTMAMASVSDPIPYKLQSAFMFKIFGSDKRLVVSTQEEVRIGIVYNSQKSNSSDAKNGIIAELGKAVKINKIVGKAVSNDFLLVDTSLANWESKIDDVSIVYVADGISDVVDSISSICIQKQIRTICVDKDYLDSGICAAVVFETGKPKIYINKKVAKDTGVQFNSMVLKHATII